MTIFSSLFSLLILLAICFLGIFSLIWRIKRYHQDEEFILEYLDKFRTLAMSDHVDPELYTWLTMNAQKIQLMLGAQGRMLYRPPFSDYAYRNYQLIINTLPEIRTGTAHKQTLSWCDDAMLRYLGILSEYSNRLRGQIKNPIIWFREGVGFILSIPAFLLGSLGILGRASGFRLLGRTWFRFFSGIIALISLIAAVMTIILGWSKFIGVIRAWLQ